MFAALESAMRSTSTSNIESVRSAVSASIVELNIGARTAIALTQLVVAGKPLPTNLEYATDLLRELLNHVYVQACEEMGAVAADRSLSQCMRAASALPEATTFPPKRML
jgi:hypothetical protein